jgi:class 3 adenylate cyclase
MEHTPGREVRGIAVYTGAQLAALADPGAILVSRTLPGLVADASVGLESHGVHELEGLPGPWQVFAVIS